MAFGWILYVALAAVLAMFCRNMRGKSLQDFFDENDALHHQVHGVIRKHPQGGNWQEYQAWMKEEG